jgi:hypothetical protein
VAPGRSRPCIIEENLEILLCTNQGRKRARNPQEEDFEDFIKNRICSVIDGVARRYAGQPG